jgi:hypothetical protein
MNIPLDISNEIRSNIKELIVDFLHFLRMSISFLFILLINKLIIYLFSSDPPFIVSSLIFISDLRIIIQFIDIKKIISLIKEILKE